MNEGPRAAVADMIGRQWILIGIAALLSGSATYLTGRLVPELMVYWQRRWWGPLEPGVLILEHLVAVSSFQVGFAVLALASGWALRRGRPWARRALIVLSSAALIVSLLVAAICWLEPLRSGHIGLAGGLYILANTGFFLTCILLLSGCASGHSPKGSPGFGAQPNNRLQATAGGLGGVGPARRAFAHRA